jgi:hypothetical protein
VSLTAVNCPPHHGRTGRRHGDPGERGTALVCKAATDVGIARRLREERHHADAEREEKTIPAILLMVKAS